MAVAASPILTLSRLCEAAVDENDTLSFLSSLSFTFNADAPKLEDEHIWRKGREDESGTVD